MKKNLKRVLGVILVILGFLALITPFSPGSWLLLIGLEILGLRILLEDRLRLFLKDRHKNAFRSLKQRFGKVLRGKCSAAKNREMNSKLKTKNSKQRKWNSLILHFAFCILHFLGGCIYTDEPVPRIVHSSTISEPKLVQPSVVKPTQPIESIDKSIPGDWLPLSRLEKKWTAIVIHHSATENGNAAIFDRWHREGKDWGGVGYDFVIGNGTDSGDGQVEVTFRWRQQQTGAHCKTPDNWANESAVGICLVGNFNNALPTARQMQSLARLIGFLQNRYEISKSRVYGHNSTPGARITDCPGKRFPMDQLKSMLAF